MTPLGGRRVLVTRPGASAAAFAARLRELGADPVTVPVMGRRRIASDEVIARGLRDHAVPGAVIVLTSGHAAELVAGAARRAGLDLAHHPATVAAIGPGTAAALARSGRRADLVPETFVAEAVAERLVALGVAGRPVWLPRAAEGRPVLPERLRAAGARVTELPCYRTVVARRMEATLAAALAGPLDWVTFTSGSTVRHFDRLRRGRPLPSGCRVACIGPVTAQAARAAGHPAAIIAAEHTMTGLLCALCAATGAGEEAAPGAGGGPP